MEPRRSAESRTPHSPTVSSDTSDSLPAVTRRRTLMILLGPGLLVAATGVGAGDLAIGAFTGSKLGMTILWAVVLGAALKFGISEGLARWQIATRETLLEGALLRLPWPVRWIFLAYLLIWSCVIGLALISACGVTTHALIPVFEEAVRGKIVFGIACSLLGLILVRLGGFKLFEKCMRVCILFMFVTVLLTAGLLVEDWGEVLSGLLVPRIPDANGAGVSWTLALMGGVGGTLTVICYGYWIRETGQDGPEDLGTCRADLLVGYSVTALFGIAMVILGTGVEIEGKGANLIVALGDQLVEPLGDFARWMFLIGAFGAVFSSLLGVWQSIPYVFADFWTITLNRRDSGTGEVDTSGKLYRGYLYAIALVPMAGLWVPFEMIQNVAGILGAVFFPMLALVLLWLNGRVDWVGKTFKNRWLSIAGLVTTLVFFGGLGIRRWFG